ncbi:MAG: DUF3726 domain-containing protein [Pseudomonadales bacterium]|nr:DUF3726 domain-containing protein [Pseudomonadales bacterium]
MNVSMNELEFAVRWAALGMNVPPGLADEFAEAAAVIASLEADPIAPVIDALETLSADYQWGKLQLESDGSDLHIHGHASAIETAPVVSDAIRLQLRVEFTSKTPDTDLLCGYLHPLEPGRELVPWMPDCLFDRAATAVAHHGIELAIDDWAALWHYTTRALAPATATSRLSGAGAGLNDTD